MVQEKRVGGAKVDIEYNLAGMPVANALPPRPEDDISSAAGGCATGAGATLKCQAGHREAGQATAAGAQPASH